MKIDRRKFFKTVGTSTAALGLGSVPFVSQASSLSSQQKEDDEQVLFIGDNIAIADTVYGKVKGYISDAWAKNKHTYKRNDWHASLSFKTAKKLKEEGILV